MPWRRTSQGCGSGRHGSVGCQGDGCGETDGQRGRSIQRNRGRRGQPIKNHIPKNPQTHKSVVQISNKKLTNAKVSSVICPASQPNRGPANVSQQTRTDLLDLYATGASAAGVLL